MSGSKIRDLRVLAAFRDTAWGVAAHGWEGDETCGCFRVPSPTDRRDLCVIVSAGEGWDHVSVSRASRCPNWIEMEHIKRTFFQDDAAVMQLHVPPSEHINCHPHCLHLWRPQDAELPRPPGWMVAIENENAALPSALRRA